MRQIKEQITDYLKSLDINESSGITLTMKQFSDGERLDTVSASRNFRHFMNLLNRKVYGSRFKRFGVRINVIPSIEVSRDGRIHYHLIIKRPKEKDPSEFFRMINELWAKTKFGYRHNHFHPSIDQGWIGYITKSRFERDEIDWNNFYWA